MIFTPGIKMISLKSMNSLVAGKGSFYITIGKIFLMSPIPTITPMKTKTNKWFNAWTTPISEILDGSKNNVESTIEEGVCVRVMPGLNNSFYGPYLNGVIANNGEERVFLICLEQDSDYSYSTGLALKGEYIKPCKKKGTKKLFTKSFNDLVEVNARKRLEAIASGSGNATAGPIPSNETDLVDEVVAASDAAAGPIPSNETDLEDEFAAASNADNFADKVEVTSEEVDKKFSKRDLIAYTLVNHFLNRTNLPFFQHDN